MKGFFSEVKILKAVISELSEVAGFLWQRGWAERNAGNISVNVSHLMVNGFNDTELHPFFKLHESYSSLSGAFFLITGTGKRMRDLAHKPYKKLLLIKLNEDATGYFIISQLVGGEVFMPTSELSTHLLIHQMIAERGSMETVVMHSHVTELIAITQTKEFCNSKAINTLLWGMHPETSIFVPKGVGFVPYTLPGSVEIAEETIRALDDHDVALWEKHGVFAIGKSVGDVFDVLDILAKSAHIYLICRSADLQPEGFTDAELGKLRDLSVKF